MVSDVFILILCFPPYQFSLFGVNLWFFKKTKRALIRGRESRRGREKSKGLYNQTRTSPKTLPVSF